jgi:hypothetical protein
MNWATTAAVVLATMSLPSVAGSQPAEKGFQPHIMSWLYAGTRTVMVENPEGQWYRVALAADCPSLKNAVDVTIRESSHARSELFTGGGGCDIASITPVSDASLYPTH